MELYINTKKMIFNEDNIEHEIVLKVSDEEFYGYNILIELSDDDEFVKDTLEIIYKKDEDGENTDEVDYYQFNIREQHTWWSFPLYVVVDEKIIKFDYTKYQYFKDTDRRMALAFKINDLYNPSSEAKILRKTLRFILDELNLDCLIFNKYNKKVEDIINKNPKEK